MKLGVEYILFGAAFLLWLDIIIVLRVLANKTQIAMDEDRTKQNFANIADFFKNETASRSNKRKKTKKLFGLYLMLAQSMDLPEEERKALQAIEGISRERAALLGKIKSRSSYRRKEAAQGLAILKDDEARQSLETALSAEKDYPTKLVIANALADIKDPRSIPVLAESLLGAHRWYRDKVDMLIASFGRDAFDSLRPYLQRTETEFSELFVDLGGKILCEELREYLVSLLLQGRETLRRMKADLILTEDELKTVSRPLRREEAAYLNYKRILLKAAESLESVHAGILGSPEFQGYPDAEIRVIAIRSLGFEGKQENVESLLRYLADPAVGAAAQAGLSRIFEAHPYIIPEMIRVFEGSQEKVVVRRLAEVLAGKIEYFILRLSSTKKGAAERLIRELLAMGKVSEILEFLKLNKDEELENKLLAILREEAAKNSDVEAGCRLHLSDRLLEKCGYTRLEMPSLPREEKKDLKMIRNLYGILAGSLLFFPFLYVVRYWNKIWNVPLLEQFQNFVVDFNFDFAWYSIVVNLSYIILLILSAFQVGSETRLWNLKTMSMLFKPKMLPSVSIIAPAYNEEKTIIQSANSLLNLKYDDYELVIVNDGSKDGTLKTLVEHFSLRRVDHRYAQRLKTSPVRGIFRNPLIPRLVVVDKMNGGKADSLNAGINIAQKEYFCGIDADSLLEPDALLKVAALTLDYGVETPAMGGNIFPINGCEVDRGYLDRLALPGNKLAALQTIEYLRAFMCGRLGWAKINSLLIISGAFGLFRRERVIAVGGYMSAQERYGKGTVGEDMELVVRIARLMREKKQKYRIGYAYNANCWTEVPESAKVLKRQRDRWHRGLIDIMFFHRRLLFNPAYGMMGLVGMPYFLIFEMIGPLFEMQGYLMVFIAAIFGLISGKLALMLFVSTILLGILISMTSILIAERQVSYFNYKDTLKLLALAFLENFGPRQLFSMWRVLGFFSAMKKPKGWGTMERKGFAQGKSA
jgi:cellulose synthase/poly-beta-1,6-N-acetylglucosamine synthase-like glycosyltransferase/HEAT repeat protein